VLNTLTSTINQAVSVDNTSTFGINFNTTSLSASIFSIKPNNSALNEPFLWQYHHSAPSLQQDANGVKTVNADSVYRIASLTKVFTVLTFLINAGERYWYEPVTKYIPELAQAAATLNATQNPVDYVDWNDVTIGDLASHLAGIGRDYAIEEIEILDPAAASFLPPLNSSQIPPCSIDPTCTRAQFFAGFTKRPPVYLPGTTPVYSNAAFQILGYVLEAITNRTYASLLQDTVLTPLHMTSTSLAIPTNTTNAVIPVNETASQWAIDAGDLSPAGELFSSLRDITLFGQSILSSSLLPTAVTRRWLKPVTHTSSYSQSVGRPWEITVLPPTNSTPTTELYGKQGNIGLYSSYLILIPAYGVGIAILEADSVTEPLIEPLAISIAETLVPALQQAAQEQAQISFGGTYALKMPVEATLQLNAADGLPGIAVTNFTTNGTDLLAAYASINGIEPENLSARLYPTNAVQKSSSGKRVSWRLVAQDVTANPSTPGACETWEVMDRPTYGGYALDQFVFSLGEDGSLAVTWSIS
jgi:CubicO group peptidase (beta-lactamase class C family)